MEQKPQGHALPAQPPGGRRPALWTECVCPPNTWDDAVTPTSWCQEVRRLRARPSGWNACAEPLAPSRRGCWGRPDLRRPASGLCDAEVRWLRPVWGVLLRKPELALRGARPPGPGHRWPRQCVPRALADYGLLPGPLPASRLLSPGQREDFVGKCWNDLRSASFPVSERYCHCHGSSPGSSPLKVAGPPCVTASPEAHGRDAGLTSKQPAGGQPALHPSPGGSKVGRSDRTNVSRGSPGPRSLARRPPWARSPRVGHQLRQESRRPPRPDGPAHRWGTAPPPGAPPACPR